MLPCGKWWSWRLDSRIFEAECSKILKDLLGFQSIFLQIYFWVSGFKKNRRDTFRSPCVCVYVLCCVYMCVLERELLWGYTWSEAIPADVRIWGSNQVLPLYCSLSWFSWSFHFMFFAVLLFFSCYQLVSFLIGFSLSQIGASFIVFANYHHSINRAFFQACLIYY